MERIPEEPNMPRRKSAESAHRRTRNDHATEVAEDYVEAIAEVIDAAEFCRVKDLVERFGVTHVTVNRTLTRLERDGYVETEPYAPVKLTRKGRRLANESRRRHEIVLNFLLAHGISRPTAEIDAEGMEHHVSPETLEVMQQFAARNQTPSAADSE